MLVFYSTHNVPPANKDKITLLMQFNGVHLIVANHYRNWCKFTQVVRVREGQRRVEPTTQANCKDRPYLWRQIRSSLAKSSEACKAWAPRGITKSRCVRPPKKTCTIQPWFARMGIQPHQKMGIQPHEKLSIYNRSGSELLF